MALTCALLRPQGYEAVLASGESAALPPLAVPRNPIGIPADAAPAEV